MLIRRFPGVCRSRHVLLVVGPGRLNEGAHERLFLDLSGRQCAMPSRRQVSERVESGQKEVRAAADGGECRKARDLLPDRAFRDLEFKCPVLRADDRIPLVPELVEVPGR